MTTNATENVSSNSIITASLIELSEFGISVLPYLGTTWIASINYRIDNSPTKSFSKTSLYVSGLSVVGKVATAFISSVVPEEYKKIMKFLDTAVAGSLISAATITNLGVLTPIKAAPFVSGILGFEPALKALALTNAISLTVAMDKIGKYLSFNYESCGKPVVIKETFAQLPAQAFKYTGLSLIQNELNIGQDSLSFDQAFQYSANIMILGGLTYNLKKLTQSGFEWLTGANSSSANETYAENFVAGAFNYAAYQMFDRVTKFPLGEHEVSWFESNYKAYDNSIESGVAALIETAELGLQECGAIKSSLFLANSTYFG